MPFKTNGQLRGSTQSFCVREQCLEKKGSGMRFQDRGISVTFQYDKETGKQNANKQVRVTTCRLFAVKPEDSKMENGVLLGEAIVRQHPKDPDCKILARKYALAKAMTNAEFNKDVRKSIWTEYLKRTKVLSSGKANTHIMPV